ncbi:MAG: hypothetical protein QF685_03955 [Verrucomicrobiota bacterium]|jgi:hypothetical protein|nr:hypothetical protein [Verrucomicrobiota bacterium]
MEQLVVVIAIVFIVLAIAAVIFRAACRICNVENIPGFFGSMGIVLLAQLVSAIISFVVGFVVGLVGSAAQIGVQEIQLLATLVSFPVAVLTTALVYKPFLNVSFGKCILVWLLQVVIVIAIGIVLGIIGFVLAMVLGGM